MKDSTALILSAVILLLCGIVGIVINKPVALCGLMTVFGAFVMAVGISALADNQ